MADSPLGETLRHPLSADHDFQPLQTHLSNDAEFDEFTAGLAPRYCNFRKTTIYAGSNEIQRNIISKMTLGL